MITLWYNGQFYVEKNFFVEAILVNKNKIIKIGSTKDLLKEKYDQKINLRNKLVLPGFIDTHTHFLKGYPINKTIDLSQIKNFKELVSIVKKFLIKNKFKNTDFIFGTKLNYNIFSNLDRFELDKISLLHPIIFVTNDLHTTISNTKALQLVSLFKKNIKSSIGGTILLDSNGYPNGVFKEEAQFLIQNFISFNQKNYLKNFDELVKQANQFGITSINTCDLIDLDKSKIYKLYSNYVKTNKKLRFFHQCYIRNKKEFHLFLKTKFPKQSLFNQINSIKLFADGSFSSKTACLSQKYKNKNFQPNLKFSKSDLMFLCKLINKKNYPIVTHAIGDLASLQILNIYKNLPKEKRNGIIHGDIISTKVLKLLKQTNTMILAQPIFLNDIEIVQKALNKELQKYTYNFKNLIQNNIHLSFGTDFPVASLNPWENIYCALTQKPLPITDNIKAFKIEQKLDIYECINAYTYEGAYASFLEKRLGKIQKNYLADFIVLNQNIFQLKDVKKILKTKIIQTVVNGKIVYQIIK